MQNLRPDSKPTRPESTLLWNVLDSLCLRKPELHGAESPPSLLAGFQVLLGPSHGFLGYDAPIFSSPSLTAFGRQAHDLLRLPPPSPRGLFHLWAHEKGQGCQRSTIDRMGLQRPFSQSSHSTNFLRSQRLGCPPQPPRQLFNTAWGGGHFAVRPQFKARLATSCADSGR